MWVKIVIFFRFIQSGDVSVLESNKEECFIQ